MSSTNVSTAPRYAVHQFQERILGKQLGRHADSRREAVHPAHHLFQRQGVVAAEAVGAKDDAAAVEAA